MAVEDTNLTDVVGAIGEQTRVLGRWLKALVALTAVIVVLDLIILAGVVIEVFG